MESIDDMIPEGAAPFKGEMNKDVAVTLDKLGVYGSSASRTSLSASR